MSKIAKTVDPRLLKDDELDTVAGGETNTNSFQTVSRLLEARSATSKASIENMR